MRKPIAHHKLDLSSTYKVPINLPTTIFFFSVLKSCSKQCTAYIDLPFQVGLWIFGGVLNVDAVTAAILGLSILLITGVVTWKEYLEEAVAWDTLTWFAALIAMTGYLNKYGLISWFSQTVVKFVGGLGLSWQLSFDILVLLYFYSHYLFASGAAYIGAMFTAFLSVASALGTPPLFGTMVLSFFSNLMGGLTHYGIGSAPVFYDANYFLISIVNIIIWLGVGGVWWKAIGLW
uniref:Dicarboxylate transporter 1, chloroplastic-like n=1 Tax=Nelumbo nucifera TaxID=4432 RepID=A0A822YBV1_NELNU|nr:TPA_asm: hypothetical protein HUJ06_031250 [Nelumbo nucifera]